MARGDDRMRIKIQVTWGDDGKEDKWHARTVLGM